MVHEAPRPACLAVIHPAFAIGAERDAAHKLAGVIAFVRGLRAADTAFFADMVGAEARFAGQCTAPACVGGAVATAELGSGFAVGGH